MNRPSSPNAWRLSRGVGDFAAAVLAFWAAFQLRIQLPLPLTQYLLPADRIRFFFAEWWVVAASQILALYVFGFYDPQPAATFAERSRRLLAVTGVHGLLLMGYFFLTDRELPRSVLLLFVLLNFALLLTWRTLTGHGVGPARRRVAIIGSGSEAQELAAKIAAGNAMGLEVTGYVPAPDEPPSAKPAAGGLGARLGDLDDLPELLASGRVDDIILASSTHAWQTRLLDRLAGVRPSHSNVLLLPGPVESLIGRMRYRWVEDLPLIEVVRQSEWHIHRPLKRLIDLLGALVLLVATSPLMLLVAAAVFVSSGRPVFYRQRRIGRDRRPFTLWKFRTMRNDAEAGTGEVLAEPGDPRLIPLGALLRRLRLDELPQLFNVLGGSMSLVGPRPERPGFVERYLRQVPGYAERFTVPPGLTGLAQINGEYHSSAENKLRYDLAYIANWSPWLDLTILLRTVKIVLTSRGV